MKKFLAMLMAVMMVLSLVTVPVMAETPAANDPRLSTAPKTGTAKNFSEGTAAVIDQEVKRIIESCREKATKILKENRKVLDKLAELLIEKERIGQQEFEALFEQNDETIEEM